MDDNWIDEGDAIERLFAAFADLTRGKVEAQYQMAMHSDNVRLRGFTLGERTAKWVRVTVDDLSKVIELHVEWNDLISQVRQQLGEPPAPKIIPNVVEPASTAPGARRPRGRPPAPLWDGAHAFIDEWLAENGFSDPGDGRQAELERAVADWLAKRSDNHPPVESTIRKHVKSRIVKYKTKVEA
jgi:hypothetical protein